MMLEKQSELSKKHWRDQWARWNRESQDRLDAIAARAEEYDATEDELKAASREATHLDAQLSEIWTKHQREQVSEGGR